MSQHTKDKLETVAGCLFLGTLPLGIAALASPVAFGVLLVVGVIAATIYVLTY